MKSNTNDDQISEEVNDIITNRPNWIIRNGNLALLLVMISLLALTWTINYPDIVQGTARLVSSNPPRLMISKVGGKLKSIFVSNMQRVCKGDHLALIESTADYEEVIKLESWILNTIEAIKSDHYDSIANNHLPSLSKLGEIQPLYQSLQTQYLETIETLDNRYFDRKLQALQRDIDYISELKDKALISQQLQEQQKILLQKEFEAYEKLAEEKVIAPVELDQFKSKLLSKKQSLEQAGIQITNNNLISHNKSKEILEIRKAINDQKQTFYSTLLELKSKIEDWLYNYVIVATDDGIVMFADLLKINDDIPEGQTLFYIELGSSTYYAEVLTGQRNFGKLSIGQDVRLKVESYPSTEFGYIVGQISFISGMPNRRDSFLIKVDLPNGLTTNFNKQIVFTNYLKAEAEMITKKRRLFNRIIGNLSKLLIK